MKTNRKENPIPVRLDVGDAGEVRALHNKTGLQSQDIIRRAIRYAVPQFLSGEVDVLNYGQPLEAEKEEVAS